MLGAHPLLRGRDCLQRKRSWTVEEKRLVAEEAKRASWAAAVANGAVAPVQKKKYRPRKDEKPAAAVATKGI